MRNYNTAYFLLAMLIILGAFAAMAQNAYGHVVLGLAAATFSLLFIVQLIAWRRGESSVIDALELAGLAIVAAVLAMRVFYLHFSFVEALFGAAGFLLIVVYTIKAAHAFTAARTDSRLLGTLTLAFYGSIVLYIISMTLVPFRLIVAELVGMAAFGLFVLFAVICLVVKRIAIGNASVQPFGYIASFSSRSGLLIALFLLFSGYMGLTRIGALPRMYSDEFPKSYFELVSRAESGQEQPVNDKYQHERFKELYDKFVERNIDAKK